MAQDLSSPVPPYVSWGVFKSTIDTLAESTVPTGPLDRRVLHQLSGADHGALMSALRYLQLVDSNRRATDLYHTLVDSSKKPEEFKERLLNLLDDAYAPILKEVNLERGTISQLEKAFKDLGVAQGQMLTKTVRFFIKAYTEGGGFSIMSPHITKPSPKARSVSTKNGGGGKGRNRGVGKAAAGGTGAAVQEPKADLLPKGFQRLPIPGIEHAFIQYPVNLTTEQCSLLDGAVAFLRVYAKGQSGDWEAAK